MLEKKDIIKENEDFSGENNSIPSFNKTDSSLIIRPGSESEKNYICYLKQKYGKFLEDRASRND